MKKVVIVGGVAGGASAAARLRRLDEDSEIILFERGPHISYANCGLPYYIGNVIENEEDLLLQTPESFRQRFCVDVRVMSEVVSILRDKKKVIVKNLSNGETYEESYDKLILSPGAAAFSPDIPGIHWPKVYRLRTVADSKAIQKAARRKNNKKAVVIGGGFIGIEVMENLVKQGLEVTLVEAAPQILTQFDEEMSRILTKKIQDSGVAVRLNSPVKSIKRKGAQYGVVLQSGESISCDFAVAAIGVLPETTLAREAGLTLNERGAIVTEGDLRTSDPDIYALGDAIEVLNRITGRKVLLPLAGPANKQGRIAAGNVSGRSDCFSGVIGSSVLKVFDLTAACTGVNERTLKAEKISYEKIYLSPMNHAGYYPGGTPITMKVLFSPEGKLLGVQGIGQEGTEKRVDVIGTAIQYGGQISDLADLELCYAPPYSSAKDPVNMVGFMGSNVIAGLSKIKHWHDLPGRDHETSILLDVRTEEEYAGGHLEGAVNIPVDHLRERLEEIPADKAVWIYCQVGLRGYIAQRILLQKGYGEVYNLSGGYGLICAIRMA